MKKLTKHSFTFASLALFLLIGGIANAQDFRLTADVFRQACSSPSAQCSGFPAEPALDGNEQPVFLTVQVSMKKSTAVGEAWVPLKGLPNSAFDVEAVFVGPGGSAIKKMTCQDCFQETDGVYRIWIEPIDGSNWTAGLYTIRVSIPFGGDKILPAITQLEIPAGS